MYAINQQLNSSDITNTHTCITDITSITDTLKVKQEQRYLKWMSEPAEVLMVTPKWYISASKSNFTFKCKENSIDAHFL